MIATTNCPSRTHRRFWSVLLLTLLIVAAVSAAAVARPTLYWGSTGQNVKVLQWRLQQWGYYNGSIDGVYGADTYKAVRYFQWKNGLPVDGVVGRRTWDGLGLGGGGASGGGRSSSAGTGQAASYRPAVSGSYSQMLLSRLVASEARGEPYEGQVAVAAVALNRVQSALFPNTLSGVIFQPAAFTAVSNGLFWSRTPNQSEVNAARDALNGWDPTYGCIYYWNPAKVGGGSWIWTRPIVLRIGHHVFAR